MQPIKDRKFIPASVARDLLDVSTTEMRRLIAQRVVEVEVAVSKRGAEIRTDFASIERAERDLRPR